ncbi:MAG: M23 family metallopeptidase [Bacteroidota bacterium]
MTTLAQLTESFEFLCWFTVFLLVCWLGYRSYGIFYKKRKRFWLWKVRKMYLPKGLKMLTAITMSSMVLSAPAVLLVLSPSGRFVTSFTTVVLLFSILIVGIFELGLSLSISERLMRFGWKKVLGFLMLAILGAIFFPLSLSVPEFMTNPTLEEGYGLELPIDGTWAAGHAGESTKVNYHSAYVSQKYAIDMVKVDENACFFEGTGTEIEEVFTFKANIFSPVGGTIVRLVDNLPNKPISLAPNDTLTPAGNHVVIEFEPERYVFLAHLHPGSLAVSLGDTVEAGDLIGLAGNSGNTSWPHLHIHIQDRPEIDFEATAYPFYFRNFQHKRWLSWNDSEEAYLLRNDLFQPLEN